jgi:phage-related holin
VNPYLYGAFTISFSFLLLGMMLDRMGWTITKTKIKNGEKEETTYSIYLYIIDMMLSTLVVYGMLALPMILF